MTSAPQARFSRGFHNAVAACLAVLFLAAGCGGDDGTVTVTADEIAVAHTPPGGYGDVMPPPILERCTEPLVPEAPDLRGLWATDELLVSGAPAPADHPLWQHAERVEQCGNRVVVTSTGVIHDMRADGTVENGVHDVSAIDYRPIDVVATFEDGVLVLRPIGVPGVEVTRERDGDELVWVYGPFAVVRMKRIDG